MRSVFLGRRVPLGRGLIRQLELRNEVLVAVDDVATCWQGLVLLLALGGLGLALVVEETVLVETLAAAAE